SLLVVFFGIYLIVRSKKYIQGAILMLIGLNSFYVLTTIVIPHFAGSSGFTYWHYTEFGKNLPTAIAYMVSHPIYTIKVLFSPNKKLITELFTFIPFLFIPFLSP